MVDEDQQPIGARTIERLEIALRDGATQDLLRVDEQYGFVLNPSRGPILRPEQHRRDAGQQHRANSGRDKTVSRG